MAVSFLTPTPPSSKRPFRSGKIFQHFEGPVFEVESIGLALCEYVTGAGFSSRPSQLFFNNGRINRNIQNEINNVKKETIYKHTFHLVNYGSHLSTCKSSILKNEHQTELQTDEQHQVKTKNMGTATADTRLRKTTERDRRESVCWTWLGHRFFI